MERQRAGDMRLENLAARSVDRYEEMLGLLAWLNQQLSTLSTQAIEQWNARLAVLQEEVRQDDLLLAEQLSGSDLSGPVRQLLEKRKLLQQEALQHLKEVLPGARNAKSLLVSEMQALKNGKRALGGYRSPVVRHGTIINRRR